MQLEDLFIGDGQLVKYELTGGVAVLQFRDFRNSHFLITLHGCSVLEENDGVGYDLSEGIVTHRDGLTYWELHDSEGCVFKTEFARAEVVGLD